jgi:hypothetical protein
VPRKQFPEACIRLVTQRGKNDCAIACLATYLGRDYEEVLIAAGRVSRTVWSAGLSGPEHVKVARALGVTAKWTRSFNLDEDTGILGVSYTDDDLAHDTVLIEGRIFDPEYAPASLIDHDDYTRVLHAVPRALFIRVED